MNEKELIKFLLGELEKISNLKPETGSDIVKSIDNLVTTCFEARHLSIMAIIEAEKHFKN